MKLGCENIMHLKKSGLCIPKNFIPITHDRKYKNMYTELKKGLIFIYKSIITEHKLMISLLNSLVGYKTRNIYSLILGRHWVLIQRRGRYNGVDVLDGSRGSLEGLCDGRLVHGSTGSLGAGRSTPRVRRAFPPDPRHLAVLQQN